MAVERILDTARTGRVMVWIVAIMLFLTVLASAAGIGTWRAAAALDTQLSGRASIQIVTADPVQREAQAVIVRGRLGEMPAVRRVTAVDRAALTLLLKPWLGADAADADLPVPAMIDVDLADPAAIGRVRAMVAAVAPASRVDLHQAWMSPVGGFMNLMTWLAFGIVALVAVATAAVVMLSVRAGLESHRATIEVMHMLGSTDVQVARLFQRRIARDTALGALLGGIAGVAAVVAIGWRGGNLGSQLLAGMSLGPIGWGALCVLPVLFVVLAAAAARRAATATLARTL